MDPKIHLGSGGTRSSWPGCSHRTGERVVGAERAQLYAEVGSPKKTQVFGWRFLVCFFCAKKKKPENWGLHGFSGDDEHMFYKATTTT